MTKFYAVTAAALAGMGSVAMGQVTPPPVVVPVTVTMPAVVSIWADTAPVTLTVGQSDGNGWAGTERALGYINNVPATISVKVDGALPPVPGGANFLIFPNESSAAAAQALAQANAYNPAGSLRWHNGSGGNLGATQVFKVLSDADEDGGSIDHVWGVTIPGGVSAPPDSYSLTVTYTIAEGA